MIMFPIKMVITKVYCIFKYAHIAHMVDFKSYYIYIYMCVYILYIIYIYTINQLYKYLNMFQYCRILNVQVMSI